MSRDYQRSKVYRAEGEHSRDARRDRLRTMEQVRDYLLCVTSAEWFRQLFPRHAAERNNETGEVRLSFPLHDGRGRRAACVKSYNNEMCLPKWARTPWTILHELAHVVCPIHVKHGWEFCNAMLLIVRHAMGWDAARELLHLYEQHGVRLTPKPDEVDAYARKERAREQARGKTAHNEYEAAAKYRPAELVYVVTELLADRTEITAHG